MNSVDKAFETQMANIQKKTGKSLEELFAVIRKSGLSKHGEIREMVKNGFNLGFGDANTLAHVYLKSLEPTPNSATDEESRINEIYSSARASLRPLHEEVMKAIHQLGDFEIAPKKTYLSLRRKKQFAMVGPGTKGRLEVGLNMKGLSPTERLLELPPGGMCQYKVYLSETSEVDDELVGWIKTAYDSSG